MSELNGRIDLSGAPSGMEEMARAWGGKATPKAPSIAPKQRARRASPPIPASAPRAAPRPFHDPRDDGAPGFYGLGEQRGDEPAPPPAEGERAERDALRSFLRSDVPVAAEYARYLPAAAADALESASCRYSVWRYASDTPDDVMTWLRAAGLAYVEKGDRCLTIFAQQVRRALAEGDA